MDEGILSSHLPFLQDPLRRQVLQVNGRRLPLGQAGLNGTGDAAVGLGMDHPELVDRIDRSSEYVDIVAVLRHIQKASTRPSFPRSCGSGSNSSSPRTPLTGPQG